MKKLVAVGIEHDPSAYTMSPNEAADTFKSNPDAVFIAFPDFMRVTGLSWQKMRKELISGRLVAVGHQDENGYDNVAITGTAMVRWMTITGNRLLSA